MGGTHAHWGVWKPAKGQQLCIIQQVPRPLLLLTLERAVLLLSWYIILFWTLDWFVLQLLQLLCFPHTLLLLQVKDIDQYGRNVAACSIKPTTPAAKTEDLGTFLVTNGHATAYRSVGLTAQRGGPTLMQPDVTWHGMV